jgi:hypothetical protein
MSIWCSFHVFGLLCQEKSGSPDGIESVRDISTPISECNSIFFSKGAFPKKAALKPITFMTFLCLKPAAKRLRRNGTFLKRKKMSECILNDQILPYPLKKGSLCMQGSRKSTLSKRQKK